MMHILDLTIAEIHQALVEKRVTAKELVLESLRRAKENKDNAFEMITEEEALRQLSELGEVEVDNLLWGIPFCLKDNFSTKGMETTASSNVLKGYIPLYDSTVYKKLREKKAILIGKTTLDELAMGGSGTTGHKGITYNPWDPGHTHQVGGSSCGSAVAVSSGIVPFALGSDTGDSVRKPASLAGLVGMKPSWGRISRYGLFPFAPSLDHVAYFTRSAADSAILLSVLSGRDEHDATSSFKLVEDYPSYIGKPIAGMKIAVLNDVVNTISDKVVLDKFNKSLGELEKLGAKVDHVDFSPELLGAIYAAYMVISCAEATSNDANLDGIKFGPYLGGNTYQEVMSNARTAGFSELIKRRFVIGSFSLMAENQDVLFRRAQKLRAKIVERANQIFEEYDFIFAPAAPSIAPLFSGSGDRLSDEYLIADNHLALGNFGGFPSLTLPLGFEDGMPLGVNFTGRPFEEGKLLTMAEAFESVSGLSGLSVNNRKEEKL